MRKRWTWIWFAVVATLVWIVIAVLPGMDFEAFWLGYILSATAPEGTSGWSNLGSFCRGLMVAAGVVAIVVSIVAACGETND